MRPDLDRDDRPPRPYMPNLDGHRLGAWQGPQGLPDPQDDPPLGVGERVMTAEAKAAWLARHPEHADPFAEHRGDLCPRCGDLSDADLDRTAYAGLCSTCADEERAADDHGAQVDEAFAAGREA